MSFQILSAETRLARMVTWLAGIQNRVTDFIVGGKTRTKLEAVAVELEAQDLAFYQAVKKAMAVSVYQAFGHDLLPAIAATGEATFSRSTPATTDIVIPLGTQIATTETGSEPEKVYVTTSQDAIAIDETEVTVAIQAMTAGQSGNTGAGTISVIKTSVSGVEAVTNAATLTSGLDAEIEEMRRRRFVEFVANLQRATSSGLVRGAKTAILFNPDGSIAERVSSAIVGEPRAGLAYVYVYNGTGTTSANLVTRAQLIIDGYTETDGSKVPGYKAAGVVCVVLAATEIAVDMTAVLTVAPGYDQGEVAAGAAAAVSAYIASLGVGDPFIYHEMIERMMGVSGVVDIAVSEPTGNLPAAVMGDATFDGAGLDDATSGGTYAGAGRTDFVVEIDGTGTPDTFRWSGNGGVTWEDVQIEITGAAQELSDGATVTFAATTGHTQTDSWSWTGHLGVVRKLGTVAVT